MPKCFVEQIKTQTFKKVKVKRKYPKYQQRAGPVVMGNTLMQHRLAIAGFKMPGMKMSWRKRMKSFKETLKDERAGRDARQRMMMLAQSVLLPLLCMSLLLPLLSMSSQYANLPLNSINPSSTSCAVDSLLEKVRKCHVHGSCLGQFAILI